MKAREQQEAAAQKAQEEELKRIMRQAAETSHHFDLSTGATSMATPHVHETLMIERELQRQKQALQMARQGSIANKKLASDEEDKQYRTSTTNDDDEDEDEDDFDYDAEEMVASSNSMSRYKGDFIEMGILGRGGGGEVVKVRNRLDRRIYAVKKIILEPERGRHAKVGAVQNKKLRREVTTISRMTHKYIVRYYQAWVEGEKKEETIEEKDSSDDALEAGGEIDDGASSTDSSDDKGGSRWWARPSSESKLTENEDEDESSTSKADFLGADGFVDFGSPLLTGLGFQNEELGHQPKRKKSSLEDMESDDDPWYDSSVKVDGRAAGKAILYIQMEYCATTLRKLIDENHFQNCKEDDIWRVIRQIVEALAYLHSQQLIHRDLKPSNGTSLSLMLGDSTYHFDVVFLDSEGNIKLGDFGLATKNRQHAVNEVPELGHKLLDAIEDIRPLLGEPAISSNTDVSTGESMTGGVGTTFYRAPEQEEKVSATSRRDGSYTVQADIFSFGVIVFEIFHPPFDTYMERAQTLTTLLRERLGKTDSTEGRDWTSIAKPLLERIGEACFPIRFRSTVPENAQRIILWCLETSPNRRPSGKFFLLVAANSSNLRYRLFST
jgi:eukaryotic translation initiation factor 2-alpha kinase 4